MDTDYAQASEENTRPNRQERDKFETGESFVMVGGPFLTDPSINDAEKIFLIVLDSWAWDKDHCWPGNAGIARRCGWFTPDGRPNADKAQRIAQQLEVKKRIRRVVTPRANQLKRDRIDILGVRPGHKLSSAEGSSEGYGKNAVGVRQECRGGHGKFAVRIRTIHRPKSKRHRRVTA